MGGVESSTKRNYDESNSLYGELKQFEIGERSHKFDWRMEKGQQHHRNGVLMKVFPALLHIYSIIYYFDAIPSRRTIER